METKEYRFVDKGKWPRGPWDEEPDKIQWEDEETGLPCLIVRNGNGALCGYVGVDESHSLFDCHYSDVGVDIDVHGDLTFSARCQEDEKEHGICHIVQKGENDVVWWFGFDCAHSYDLIPMNECAMGLYFLRLDFGDYEKEYRDIDFVQNECRKLAKQLKFIGQVTNQ